MEGKSLFSSKALFIMQVMSFFLLSFYVFHSNKTATIGYILESLNEERENIITEKRMLNLKISRAQSVNNIENDPYVKEMVGYQENSIYIDPTLDTGSVKSK